MSFSATCCAYQNEEGAKLRILPKSSALWEIGEALDRKLQQTRELQRLDLKTPHFCDLSDTQ
jgi:hypothetical protein